MMSAFPGILTMLVGLVQLVAQWVGLTAMRDQRTRAWWTMVGGTAIQTLVMATLMILMFMTFYSSGDSPGVLVGHTSMLILVSMAAVVGGLLFAAGFAMHGLTRRAAREREQQLEAMVAAMAEELRVLRERAS